MANIQYIIKHLDSDLQVSLESTVARGFALGFQAANAVGSKVIEARHASRGSDKIDGSFTDSFISGIIATHESFAVK